jgi:hypothetical protein
VGFLFWVEYEADAAEEAFAEQVTGKGEDSEYS